MPNWAEGTMKVRGHQENVLRFLREGLQPISFGSNKKLKVLVELDKWDTYVMKVVDENGEETNRTELYLDGSRRAFVYKLDNLDIEYTDGLPILEFKFKQAWAVIAEDYVEISKKYNIDIHIFTWEEGMQFAQEVEVLKGEVTNDVEIKYDDYMWDAPFNGLGG